MSTSPPIIVIRIHTTPTPLNRAKSRPHHFLVRFFFSRWQLTPSVRSARWIGLSSPGLPCTLRALSAVLSPLAKRSASGCHDSIQDNTQNTPASRSTFTSRSSLVHSEDCQRQNVTTMTVPPLWYVCLPQSSRSHVDSLVTVLASKPRTHRLSMSCA